MKKSDHKEKSTVFFKGLHNPRGIKFGPDSTLYIAEGGSGGDLNTINDHYEQVSPPIGPCTGGFTARISNISKEGNHSIVVDNLPSSQTSKETGSRVSGVADIAFVHKELYALISGAGNSHGLKNTVNGVIKINSDHSVTQIADLSTFWQSNPIKNAEKFDIEPDGTPYSMIEVKGKLYIVEPNRGELDEVSMDGTIKKITDFTNYGHIVPTSIVFHDGKFFIGNLQTFPVVPGSARIFQVTMDGSISELAPKLTAVTSLAIDNNGNFYALESSTKPRNRIAGSGQVVKISLDEEKTEIIVKNLFNPTCMTLGSDEKLYISNYGFDFKPGEGQINRINLRE